MDRSVLAFSVVFIAGALALGCSVSSAGGTRTDAGTGGQDGSPSPRPDSGPIRFDECASNIATAETRVRPVDIVWIIDNSGSMSGEAEIVQNNMNGFAAAIASSGIDDYHVIVITRAGFVNVPAPLGTDAERFRFVAVDVQSNDGLIDLVDNYALYSDFLRPHAPLHFVVVTDDESERMTWTEFRTRMESLLGRAFVFHTIASPPGSTHCPLGICFPGPIEGCQGPEDDASANGDEYWALSEATGGLRFSICTNDWSGLFSTLTAAVAVPMRLPCRYGLPETDEGMEVDRTKVNVLYTPSSTGVETVIPYVREYGSCGPSGGWYYEGEDVVVCPATCSTLMADASGQVQIAVGCATILF